MKKNIGILALLLTVVGFSFSTGTAQSKTNLTGTWKMNPTKSVFERQGPDSIVIKLEQKDSLFTESLSLSGEQGERTVSLKYASDGKEHAAEFAGEPAKVTATWEGETLIVTMKQGEGRSFTRKLTISPDGKTINMTVKMVQPDGGETQDKILLEKQ